MPVCKFCKAEKPNREMSTWGGSTTETCLECKEKRKADRKEVKSATPAPASPAPSGIEGVLKIEFLPSLGFSASIDEDKLVITQANGSRENDDDNITLTKEEANGLFRLFGAWAGVA